VPVDGVLQVEVSDDGGGISGKKEAGMGLLSMREQAEDAPLPPS
jgi:signal transduction histidine kinase